MIQFFFDPILRAPTIGCMLMCLACSLIGVIVFIRKESLLGETLAHATYPGIMLGSLLVALSPLKSYSTFGLCGAALSCVLSIWVLHFVRSKIKLKSDSALCFVLALFFGLGLTLSSYLQSFNSIAYKQARIFLLGQAATITDQYLFLYAGFALFIILSLILFYKAIQIVNFDSVFAKSVGINVSWVVSFCYFLLIGSIVIGTRSIGLLLLSGMLMGPAIAARQWTNHLSRMLFIAGIIGLISGFAGIFLSAKVAEQTQDAFSLATGPTILLVSASISLFSLIFAPQRGWVIRSLRILKFKLKCNEENILKSLWHFQQKDLQKGTLGHVYSFQSLSKVHYLALLVYLDLKGYLKKEKQHLYLTKKGQQRAARIVRMHRLWELYLVHIGVGKERVHHNAEEMEHIITPQIEQELLRIMDHPTKDPHNQPIPSGGALC